MIILKNKVVSLLLAVVLVITMMPTNVLAADVEVENPNADIKDIETEEKEINDNVPEKPTLNTATSTMIILNSVDGCEYSLDGKVWQESYVFKDLQPKTMYKLYQRYSETETTFASRASEPLEVTTKDKSNSAIAPELVSVDGNIVKLKEVSGYEYKYIGGEWQTENTFVLDSFSTYEFVQREKETDTMEAGEISTSISVNTGRITKLPSGAKGIYTKKDLENMKKDKDIIDEDSYYILMNDIKFIDADFEENGEFYNEGRGWEPIKHFSGKIDGNGYSIKNLKSFSEDEYGGFIRYNFGEILNLNLEDTEYVLKSKNGPLYLGGIAAASKGIISGCSVSGNINIEQLNNDNLISIYAGGICAANYDGKIDRCASAMIISAESNGGIYVGGITGGNYENGIIENCYNIGEILAVIDYEYNAYGYVGGIIGNNEGQVNYCHNIGVVDSRRSNSPDGAYSGGIAGINSGTMKNCYYSELQYNAAGKNSSSGAERLAFDKLSEQDSYEGFDFDNVWVIDEQETSAPYLKNQKALNLPENTSEFAGGNGTIFSPYRIETAKQLANINNHLGANYILCNDISFDDADFQGGGMFYNEGKGWISIGCDFYSDFEGIFNGQNNTIKGLVVRNQKYMGLFGSSHGEIKNVNVEDIRIESDSVNTIYTGGVVAANYERPIINCSTNASIYVKNAINITAGGLVGETRADVFQCSAKGDLNLDSKTNGLNNEYAGGIAGKSSGSIIDSCSLSNILLKCTNFNNIYIGGIIGGVSDSLNIENSYCAGELYGEHENSQKDYSDTLYRNTSSKYSVEVINSYLLSESESIIISGKNIAKNAKQFSSGEVAYLLNDGKSVDSVIWRQNLGENGDDYPVLDDRHSIVYKCDKINCKGERYDYSYNNTNLPIDEGHIWEDVYTVDKEATCIEEGSKSIHCKNCEEVKDKSIIPKKDHIKKETVLTAPNFFKKGKKLIICEVCHEKLGEKITTYTGKILRISGNDRYITSMKSADALKESLNVDRFDNIVVACGTDYPDALTGSYLAQVKNAPVILVNKSSESSVKKYIDKNLKVGGKVYILGGTGAVSKSFENKVKTSKNVKRLWGNNRYETNIAILKEAGVKNKELLICSGAGYADSLSASAVDRPILLVDKKLKTTQISYVKNADKCYIIGGTGVVSNNLYNNIKKYTGVERISGKDRYSTSTAVANKFLTNKEKLVVLAYGMNFPDGLSGGPLAASIKSPLLLVEKSNYNQAVSYGKSKKVNRGIVLGGKTLISDGVVNKIVQ